MSEPTAFSVVTTTIRTIDADTVFLALSDPTRRQILISLIDGKPHAVSGIGGSLPKHRDLVRKHCETLVNAGLILREANPQDARRSLYKLAPGVKTSVTAEGRTLDFGCCILRC